MIIAIICLGVLSIVEAITICVLINIIEHLSEEGETRDYLDSQHYD